YIKLIERREALTTGAEEGDKNKEGELADLQESYETKILQARTEAIKEKQSTLNAAKATAARLLDKVKHETEDKNRQAKQEIEGRKIQLQQDAQKEAEVIASQMVEKVLAGKDLTH